MQRRTHTGGTHTSPHHTHSGEQSHGLYPARGPRPGYSPPHSPLGGGGPARASPVLCNPSSPEESPAQSVKDASVLTGSVRTSPFQAKKTDPSWAPDTIERGCGLMRLHQFRSAQRRKKPHDNPNPESESCGRRLRYTPLLLLLLPRRCRRLLILRFLLLTAANGGMTVFLTLHGVSRQLSEGDVPASGQNGRGKDASRGPGVTFTAAILNVGSYSLVWIQKFPG